MAGNALEILQMSCFCENAAFWNGYVCEDKHLMDYVSQKSVGGLSPPASPFRDLCNVVPVVCFYWALSFSQVYFQKQQWFKIIEHRINWSVKKWTLINQRVHVDRTVPNPLYKHRPHITSQSIGSSLHITSRHLWFPRSLSNRSRGRLLNASSVGAKTVTFATLILEVRSIFEKIEISALDFKTSLRSPDGGNRTRLTTCSTPLCTPWSWLVTRAPWTKSWGETTIAHFTVVCFVAKPSHGGEAIDLTPTFWKEMYKWGGENWQCNHLLSE